MMLSSKSQDSPKIQPPPRWKVGVDRRHVAIFVGMALIGGFIFGFATARFMNSSASPAFSGAAEAASKRDKAIKNESDLASSVDASQAGQSDFHMVTRVLRADTMEIQGVGTVRMIGVETPDGKEPQQIYAAHGRNALAFVESSLLNKEVRLEFDPATGPNGNRDSSGFTLAYVFTRDGGLFNGEIIKQGQAFVQASITFKYLDQFRALERDAMQSMRGVWGFAANGASSSDTSTQTASNNKPATGDKKKLSPLSSADLDPRVSSANPSTDPTVYVSASDRLYHKEACEYLSKKKQALSLSQAKVGGFLACGRCFASTVMKAP